VEGKDFVKRLLKVIPEERFSAEDALQHPWVKGPKPQDYVIEVVYSNDDLCSTTGEIMKKDKGLRVIDVDVR